MTCPEKVGLAVGLKVGIALGNFEIGFVLGVIEGKVKGGDVEIELGVVVGLEICLTGVVVLSEGLATG